MCFFVITGFVAFVVGGYDHKEVELFSPDGNCQHKLASTPLAMVEPVLTLIDDKILACGGFGNRNCFRYHPNNDSWSVYSTAMFTHSEQPGANYNGSLFLFDDTNPEVFDLASNTWSSWPVPLKKAGDGPCLVGWKDTFLLLGGDFNKEQVQVFNHSSNTWQVLNSTTVRMIFWSGCVLLPNDKILIHGSDIVSYYSSALLYNIRENTWITLPDTSVNRHGTSLVTLGTRAFAIDGYLTSAIEEFHYNNNTWSSVEARLIVQRYHHGTIALPAELFQHLPGGCVGVQ
jgi:hypothetical protein